MENYFLNIKYLQDHEQEKLQHKELMKQQEVMYAELEKLKCIEVQLMDLSKENIELHQLKTKLESEVVR